MKTALVTGASRGIGKAIAEKLKVDNYKVLGTATSDSGVDTLNTNGIEGYLLDLNSKDSIDSFWSQLESDNKTISVTRCVQLFDTVGFTKTKNGQRQVPLSESLAQDLKVFRLSQGVPDKEALVFHNNGKRIFGQKLRDVLKKACKQAGVEVIRWHDLRHFFASILLQTYGDDLHKVTSFMGHGSIEMTRKVYGHWLDDSKRNAEDAAKLDAALTL